MRKTIDVGEIDAQSYIRWYSFDPFEVLLCSCALHSIDVRFERVRSQTMNLFAAEVDTGGFGSMVFANIAFKGNEVGMLYEKHKKGHSSLVLGNRKRSLTPAYASSPPSTRDLVQEDSHLQRKNIVYFERGRNGKWGPVHVPTGMTKRQLHRFLPPDHQRFRPNRAKVPVYPDSLSIRRKLVLEQQYAASLSAEEVGCVTLIMPASDFSRLGGGCG